MAKPNLNQAVGEALVALRIKRNLTMRELGDAAGISQSTVYKLEAGSMKWTVEYLERVGTALGITPSQLLKRAGA